MKPAKTTVKKQKEVTNYLLTIILDYQGGSYISQVEASSLKNALILWVQNLNDDVKGMTLELRKKLLEDIMNETDKPVKVLGVKNVFFVVFRVAKKLALINMVLTSDLEAF